VQDISKETIESLGFVFTLDVVDNKLVEALGDFLVSVSKKKLANYEIIMKYFEGKLLLTLLSLNEKLSLIPMHVDSQKLKFSPGKSAHEHLEEGMQIDTGAHEGKVALSEQEERAVKAGIKLKEESELVLKILRILNRFYKHFHDIQVEPEKMDLKPK